MGVSLCECVGGIPNFRQINISIDSPCAHVFIVNLFLSKAKARTGNPFLAQGRERDRVEGPLAEFQIKRGELRALKILGAGQFGKVYLALHSSSEGDVRRAVKMLRSGASTQDREEFLREAETMLRLGNNENLV